MIFKFPFRMYCRNLDLSSFLFQYPRYFCASKHAYIRAVCCFAKINICFIAVNNHNRPKCLHDNICNSENLHIISV